MRELSKLEQVMKECKCAVFVSINEHRNYYKTVTETLEEALGNECPPDISPDIREKMIELDTIIVIQAYNNTPVGSYELYHYSLEMALDELLEVLKKENEKKEM